MTQRCFSSSQLYALRNQINVQGLIEKTLRIPCEVTKGCFRFLCPLCSGFNTAVNPETNLARCFRCEKNYNTIDLVMLTRQADFVQSVKFLKAIHQKDDDGHCLPDVKTIPASQCQAQGRINPKTPSKTSPQSIGAILESVLPPNHGSIEENRMVESKSNQSTPVRQIAVEDRIVKLEQKIALLDRQIKKIAQAFDVDPASK